MLGGPALKGSGMVYKMANPRVVEVIESYNTRGRGTTDDPCRCIRQYHTCDGEFLAEEYDKWLNRKQNDHS